MGQHKWVLAVLGIRQNPLAGDEEDEAPWGEGICVQARKTWECQAGSDARAFLAITLCNPRVDTNKSSLNPSFPAFSWDGDESSPTLVLDKSLQKPEKDPNSCSTFLGRTCKSCFIKPPGNFSRVSRPPGRFHGAKPLPRPWRSHSQLPLDTSEVAWMVSMISTSAYGNIGTNLGVIFLPHEPQACEDKAQRQLGKRRGKRKGKKNGKCHCCSFTRPVLGSHPNPPNTASRINWFKLDFQKNFFMDRFSQPWYSCTGWKHWTIDLDHLPETGSCEATELKIPWEFFDELAVTLDQISRKVEQSHTGFHPRPRIKWAHGG